MLGLSLLFTGAFTFFMPDLGDAFRQSPWRVVADSALYSVVFGLVAVFVYHILRQLRMVSLIHASARHVSLFRLTPLYAFSGLTAQTGIGLLLLNYFSVLTDPTAFVNPPLTALRVFASLVAVACFVLPLRGMHQRIAAEKARLRAETNTQLEATIQEVLRRADTENPRGTYHLNQLMASLVTTRELLAKIPTWPWETSTLTGFITAFLLPLALRLLNMLLERFAGP